jgi:hypothetical protein
MTVTLAGTTFDHHHYDDRGDVLYLSVGAPGEPARTIATPEGHAVDYDEDGPGDRHGPGQRPLALGSRRGADHYMASGLCHG